MTTGPVARSILAAIVHTDGVEMSATHVGKGGVGRWRSVAQADAEYETLVTVGPRDRWTRRLHRNDPSLRAADQVSPDRGASLS